MRKPKCREISIRVKHTKLLVFAKFDVLNGNFMILTWKIGNFLQLNPKTLPGLGSQQEIQTPALTNHQYHVVCARNHERFQEYKGEWIYFDGCQSSIHYAFKTCLVTFYTSFYLFSFPQAPCQIRQTNGFCYKCHSIQSNNAPGLAGQFLLLSLLMMSFQFPLVFSETHPAQVQDRHHGLRHIPLECFGTKIVYLCLGVVLLFPSQGS